MDDRATAARESGQMVAQLDPSGSERLEAYRYLTAPDAALYIAIMRFFAGSLLAEWTAHDVMHLLGRSDLDHETVEDRLRQLANWGNLVPSPREVRVTSIAEYHRQRARYQISKLGSRIQRDVEVVLAAADGAREVSRELLALVARGLAALADEPATDSFTGLSGRVSTLFLQFAEFAASIRDFYAYVGSVLSRFDLDSAEYDGFKQLLLDYLDAIVDDVDRHSPAIEASLNRLWGRVPALLAAIDTDSAFKALQAADPGAAGVDRTRGHRMQDWVELRDWFLGADAHGSGAEQLRAAARRALGSLLSNLKRINLSRARETSHRRDLLRLAAWFDAATIDEAHALFDAAFAMHSSRHLGVALSPDEAEAVAATTSWWSAPTAPVPVSLRERGDRAARGRTSKAENYAQQRDALLRKRAAEARRRAEACDELAAAAMQLANVRLSGFAMRVFLELFTVALQRAAPGFGEVSAEALDTGLRIRLVRRPGLRTIVRSHDGDLTIDDLEITILRAHVDHVEQSPLEVRA